MKWGEGTEHEPDTSGECARRLAELSALWERPRHHVVLAIALVVLARQAGDGIARVGTGPGGTRRDRMAFAAELPLREAVRTVGDLVGDATAVLVTTPGCGSALPEEVRLEIADRADGTFAIRGDCTERQTARLITALRHGYEPSALVSEVPLHAPADETDLAVWERNLAPVPASTLDGLFSRVARTAPGRDAVVADGERLTYAEAHARAGLLASLLLGHDLQLGEPVVVLSDHPLRAVVGQLAVLMAGGVCVPVGRLPADRVRRTAGACQARHAVVDRPSAPLWGAHCRTVTLEEAERRARAVRPDPSLPRSGFTDLAYLLGGPPGGDPCRARLSAHEAWVSAATSRIHRVGRPAREVVVHAAPWEQTYVSAMWWAFLSGGTLRPHDPADRGFRRLARGTETDLLLSPGRYRRMLDASDTVPGPGPRSVVLTGGPCPPELAKLHFTRVPAARLLTEFGADGGPLPWTVREIGPDDCGHGLPPQVGRPSPNVRVRVLDAAGHALPYGLPGELCAEGSALPCGGAARDGAASGNGPLLRSGRRGMLRADGSVELADLPADAPVRGTSGGAAPAPEPPGAAFLPACGTGV
ncbi:AMP-binding protein [Streptomyces sp. TRM 70361]|uniref:AMP-binding protein n=1 Tax=Streptomyces sp. TRM 70361 TaxID=3116553 RepID=UPI002E7C2E0C|nr:AMP-binding protein [Streptomyces sp. TRM 70361]MEE1938044.1 AMP-binding protein [Streptomyces sp. TRM 70361]